MKVTTHCINHQMCPDILSLNTLNDIIIEDSSGDQVDRLKQPDPERDNITSFTNVHSTLTPEDA